MKQKMKIRNSVKRGSELPKQVKYCVDNLLEGTWPPVKQRNKGEILKKLFP